MTNYCQAKRGFFTLRGCNRIALKSCEQCGRPTCQQHLSMRTGNRLCLDCAAKQSQQNTTDYTDDWAYSYRNWYYTNRGYYPIGYSDTDYGSFDNRGDALEDIDDGTNVGGDFSDS